MSTQSVLGSVRLISPAFLDTRVFSCISIFPAIGTTCAKSFSTANPVCSKESPNKDFKINPLFENRNPRNLEFMGLARKRQGWVLQAPRKDFYHRVVFEQTNRHTAGLVEHFSGNTVISASTVEWAIRDGLYSCVDVSAAYNVGRILAQRCLESGITEVFCEELEEHKNSEKMQAFLSGLQELGLGLEETKQKRRKFVPGIDSDRATRIGEAKKWKDDYQPV